MKVTNNPSIGVDAAAQANHSKKTDKANTAAEGRSQPRIPTEIEGDMRPQISDKARELSTAKKVATMAPDVREAKIAELKERIAAGRYHVDPKVVADRLVDEHLSSGIG
jgi:negative regulator of flagellin synthesis FlgM